MKNYPLSRGRRGNGRSDMYSKESIESHLVSRRDIVIAGASLLLPGVSWAAEPNPRVSFGLPGPFRGKVVEVAGRGSVAGGQVSETAVRSMLARGMVEMTGARDASLAWKRFVKHGEVIGIKVSPVGRPLAISQPETVREIVYGLNSAGIKNEDIIVFNRYESEYRESGIGKLLPAGVRQAFAAADYDDIQTKTEGYDTEVFVEFPRVTTGQDKSNPINRRSHLCTIASTVVDKIINISSLKDHASAGVTMALKNLSHGMTNNVCRSHATSANNWCDTFIPGVVSLPKIRQKVVLNICDGLIGCYDGGPGIWNKHFRTWEYGALFFSTDPVAMDRVGWQILDKKRTHHNLPPLAQTGKKLRNPGFESFDQRQPQHVLLAAKAGLGEADLAKIIHKRIELKT